MHRAVRALSLAALVVSPLSARASITDFAVEYDQFDRNPTIADHALGASEYQFQNQYFRGSGSGAGGVLGGASSRLYFSASNLGIVLGFQPGAIQSGTLVVMVDAGTNGGRNAGSGPGLATLNDTTDAARAAVSSLRGHYPTTGAFDDRYEYAVTFNTNGAAVWAMPDDSGSTLTPIAGYSGPTGTGSFFREALIPMGNGQWGSVPGFALFAAYIGTDGALYNESLPAQPFTGGANPGIGASVDFTNAALVAEFIPAPTAAPLMLLAALTGSRRARRTRR